jgi:uncharacterized protein YndB with AHSA1/START domain
MNLNNKIGGKSGAIIAFLVILISSTLKTNGQSQTDMDKTLIIKKERQINADPKKVWFVLTTPAEIKKWLGVEAKSTWAMQSDISFTFTWDGKEYMDKGKVIRFDKERVFSYSYWSGFSGLPDAPENYSKIEFFLVPTKSTVTLKLTHSDFATDTMYQHSDKNWEETLNEIKRLSEETDDSQSI